MQKNIQKNVYTLDLSYSKRDFTVNTIIGKLKGWKRTKEWKNVTYVKREVNLWGFWPFRCVSKNIIATVDSERYMKQMCETLWIEFRSNKFVYEKDLFQLF